MKRVGVAPVANSALSTTINAHGRWGATAGAHAGSET